MILGLLRDSNIYIEIFFDNCMRLGRKIGQGIDSRVYLNEGIVTKKYIKLQKKVGGEITKKILENYQRDSLRAKEIIEGKLSTLVSSVSLEIVPQGGLVLWRDGTYCLSGQERVLGKQGFRLHFNSDKRLSDLMTLKKNFVLAIANRELDKEFGRDKFKIVFVNFKYTLEDGKLKLRVNDIAENLTRSYSEFLN